ncbi:MAG: VanZ family protein, partial [Geminicoccaceae bacterium]|nr:VanZ family protein [Geminicoccaceae bacterium]
LHSNGARWTERGSLSLPSEGLVVGERAPAWLTAAIAQHQLTIELRFRPAAVAQWGEVLTIGHHGRRQTLSISQKNRHLIVRVRRACRHVEALGLPCTTGRVLRRVIEPGRWIDLELVVEPGELTVALNGEVVLGRPLTDAPLAVWDGDQPVALGNDPDGSWPWLGEIERATVRTGAHQVDLLDPALYRSPGSYWAFDRAPQLVPFRDAPIKDMVHNLVMYVPLGALLALLGFWPHRSGLVRALVVTGLVSLTMETTQVFFSNREPSLTDLLLNATGGAFGFALVRTLETDPRVARLLTRIGVPGWCARHQQG